MAALTFLEQKQAEIAARIAELAPFADEHRQLEAVLAALATVPRVEGPTTPPPNAVRTAASAPPRTKRKRVTSAGASGTARRGRPKGTGTRDAEALALVKATPGITIPDLAEKMGIKPNYLYRVLPRLAQQGLVVKDERGWVATPAAS